MLPFIAIGGALIGLGMYLRDEREDAFATYDALFPVSSPPPVKPPANWDSPAKLQARGEAAVGDLIVASQQSTQESLLNQFQALGSGGYYPETNNVSKWLQDNSTLAIAALVAVAGVVLWQVKK